MKKNLGLLFYCAEHIVEFPVDRLIFGRTRYDDDSWYFRCMCARILWIYDLLACLYYTLRLEYGLWDAEDWNKYRKIHNQHLLFIGHCKTYVEMRKLNPIEFDKSMYCSSEYIKYIIPVNDKPTKDELKRWLLH